MVQKQQPQFNTLSRDLNEIGSRVRVMEERYSSLRKKTQLTDQSLLDTENTISKDLKGLNAEIMDLKNVLRELQEKIDLMTGEFGNAAKMHDFQIVKKYVELWQPTRFITRKEAEDLLQKKDL